MISSFLTAGGAAGAAGARKSRENRSSATGGAVGAGAVTAAAWTLEDDGGARGGGKRVLMPVERS